MQAYAAVAVSFAGRGCELYQLKFENIKRSTLDNEPIYKVFYKRSKGSGPREAELPYAIVSGRVEVKVLDDYISCFKLEEQHGRFFTKLRSRNGKLEALSKMPIGKK
jgi:hypothetical protein